MEPLVAMDAIQYAEVLTRNAGSTVVTVPCNATLSGLPGSRRINFVANVSGLVVTADLVEDAEDTFDGAWVLGERATPCRFHAYGVSQRSLALIGRQERRENEGLSLWVLELERAGEPAF